jgi:undecaprenyl-diphosphatase
MTALQALILGIVQGATEFLPVSSSGHLVLVPWLLGWKLDPQAAFVFDVLVQWGTLLAVITYFWRDLLALIRAAVVALLHGHPLETHSARMAWLLVLASLPAAVIGLAFKDAVEATFSQPAMVFGFLLVTAGLLAVGEWLGQRSRAIDGIRWTDALWIGCAQVLALFPGVSRSGSTIAGGMTRNLRRADSARFAFLMSVPIMIGAGLVALRDLLRLPDAGAQASNLVIGFLAAAVVGYLAIRWLLRYLSHRPLTVFIAYTALVGVVGLVMSIWRG